MCIEKRRLALRNRRGPLAWALTAGVLLLAAGGCSKGTEEASSDASAPAAQSGAGTLAETAAPRPQPDVPPAGEMPSETSASLPAVQVDANTPTVDQEYPQLASAGLVHARLATLPDGVLLQAGGVVVTQKDMDAEIARMPPDLREPLRKNTFYLLEQMATPELLAQEARAKTGGGSADEQALLQSYFQTLVQGAEVSDREVAEFYEKNRETAGLVPLEQLKEQIRQYLLQQKQQEMVDQHVRNLGRRTTIAVSADWVDAQAKLAKDNPVDKARASGKPTFANFGAKGCVPCDMMEPIREALRKKYEGKLNVVFVHVGNDQILASRYGVQGIPLLVFFDASGKEVHRHTGYMDREKIEEHLADLGVK